MRSLLAMLVFTASPAFAWNSGALAYLNQQPQYQQPAPQESYSEQYNRGYMNAYLAQHGYQPTPDAYHQGENDAYRAQRRGY